VSDHHHPAVELVVELAVVAARHVCRSR
jgi:hypothetical protein